jgi:hypothetical protein
LVGGSIVVFGAISKSGDNAKELGISKIVRGRESARTHTQNAVKAKRVRKKKLTLGGEHKRGEK